MKPERDLLKGRVKRLLKEQKEMGQVGELAVRCCVLAVQMFVKNLATNMQTQATNGQGLTPIELKKCVLATPELKFLHEKVTAIDDINAAKYCKSTARDGRKRTLAAAAKKSSTKKARATKTVKKAKSCTEMTAAKPAIVTAKKRGGLRAPSHRNVSGTRVSSGIKAQALVNEEDEDYDESDDDDT